MNPIPRINAGPGFGMPPSDKCGSGATTLSCRQFDPTACHEDPERPWWELPGPDTREGDVEGACSGDWTGGQIADTVHIPADLPAGDYVRHVRHHWSVSHALLSHVPPLPRCVAHLASYPCLLDAYWCVHSDVATYLRLQVLGFRWDCAAPGSIFFVLFF